MASEPSDLPTLGKASWKDLEHLQGRWQHSLDDMGLFSVYGDVALFDRGTALRLKSDRHGSLYAWGWVLSWDLSGDEQLVWRRPDDDRAEELAVAMQRAGRMSDHLHWKDMHLRAGTCAWRRPPRESANLQDRFARLPPAGLPGFPERVSMFAVPPPADMPATTRPWRLLVYGGCLTIGWPSGDVYARMMVDRLGELGFFAEVIGCGVSAHTSDQLAAGMWRRDLYDKMGLRGEGLLRLLRRQGPFDLVLVMAGVADTVRGRASDAICELHRACHRLGARTVAVSVPPSWHDSPEDMHPADVERAQRLDENFGFCSPEVVARSKKTLNQGLQDLVKITQGLARPRGYCALYVDTSRVIPCNSRSRSLWEPADFIHLTAWGYQTLGWGVAEQLAPLLERLAREGAEGPGGGGAGGGAAGAGPAGPAPEAWPATGRFWRVRGGTRKGGLIVRQDKGTDSLFHSGRLSNGALLEELDLCEDRLRYRKLSGEGPDTGWVSVCTKTGSVLVERCDKLASDGAAPVASGPRRPEQPEPDVEPQPREEPAATALAEPAWGEEAEPEAAPEAEGDMAPQAAPDTAPPAPPPRAARDDGAALKPSTGRAWRVIGGYTGAGLVVRHGREKNSQAHAIRLVNASVLEEIELDGGRLRYRLRCGSGPHTGWVSVTMNGKPLVEPDASWEDMASSHGLGPGGGPAAGEPGPRRAAPAAAPAPAPAAEASTLWRCVHRPRVAVRQERALGSSAVGLVKFGQEVVASGEPENGWIRLQNGRGYVLTDHEELGVLLARVEPGRDGGA